MRVILLAVLLMTSLAFKIRQDSNGYNEAMADANAGIAATTSAFNDAVTAGIDATNLAVSQFNQILGQLMGGLTGGTRVQQGYNDAIAEGTQSANEGVAALQALLAAGTDVINAVVGQTSAIVGQMTGGGSRLQQGGNPFAQAMADFTAAWNDAIQSTQDGLTAGADVVVDTANTAESILANAQAGTGRLQQGGNAYADAMAAITTAWNDVITATEETLTAGADAVADTAQLTNGIIGTVAAPSSRLQQGTGLNTVMGDLAALGGDLAAATTAFIDAGADATSGLAAQADQVVNSFAGAGAGTRRR